MNDSAAHQHPSRQSSVKSITTGTNAQIPVYLRHDRSTFALFVRVMEQQATGFYQVLVQVKAPEQSNGTGARRNVPILPRTAAM